MNPFDVMREWDAEADILPRSDEDLISDVTGSLTCRVFHGDWEEWLEALRNGNTCAILEGRAMWGLTPLA